jgi:hypothetical protein
MNSAYFRWLVRREVLQPTALLTIAVILTLLTAIIFFVRIEAEGGALSSLSIGPLIFDERGVAGETIAREYLTLAVYLGVFLFIVSFSSSIVNLLYHPMRDVMLTTAVTKLSFFASSMLAPAVCFSVLFFIGTSGAALVVGWKAGIWMLDHAFLAAACFSLLFLTMSAFGSLIAVVVRKSAVVFLLLLPLLFFSDAIRQREEWFFAAMQYLLPSLTTIENAAVAAVFFPGEVSATLIPVIVGAVSLAAAAVIYQRQDV